MGKHEIRIPCNCGGHHSITFTKWDDETDLWLSMINADNYTPFWGRVHEAIRYIFGKEVAYHDVVIDKEHAREIAKFFEEIK